MGSLCLLIGDALIAIGTAVVVELPLAVAKYGAAVIDIVKR